MGWGGGGLAAVQWEPGGRSNGAIPPGVTAASLSTASGNDWTLQNKVRH